MPFTVFDVMVLIVATEKSNARKTDAALEAMIRLWLVPTVERFPRSQKHEHVQRGKVGMRGFAFGAPERIWIRCRRQRAKPSRNV